MSPGDPVVMTSAIDISVERGVAQLTLQRSEKRNAVTAEMWEGIVASLADLTGHVHGLTVTGAGGVFSAGADLASVRAGDGSRSEAYHDLALRGLAAIRRFPHPTVAVVDGPCIGGGCSIALACDLRFASPRATFAVPAVRYGFSYDEWSLRRLVELIGSGQATRFLLSALTLSGHAAADLGLVELCSDDPAGEAADYLAAVSEGDPETVVATRRSIRRSAGLEDSSDVAGHAIGERARS